MADFTLITLAPNTGTLGVPVWTNVLGGANTEIRWSDVGTGLGGVASAAWPAMIRPAATAAVSRTYAFTADAVGLAFLGTTSDTCPAFDNANYLWARWSWDNTGTFASAPILTAYPSSAHGAITPNDGSMLGGKIADTGGAGYSYLKGNAFGRVVSAGAPAAAPAIAPVVTDGTVGVKTPAAGANWLANYQDLQGDNDWIAFPSTPAATTADQWNIIFALFTGPNMVPATYTVVMSLKYTWT